MRQPVPFGKYLLLDRISVGGMAEVFKAKSYGVEGFEKIIAIKRILPTMGEDRDFIKMFIDEAKIAGQLAHANICQIFELGRIDGSHFIAMEYIWGKDLLQIQNRLRKLKQHMPVPMACFVIAKVLEGLDYAHRKRDPLGRPLEIVHRDCSPQNVLVSYEGEVKVIDFGIAKATSRNSRTMAGVLKGKFGYMSPEQVRGLPLDRRSDLFALGTMLFECLTGERLFQGETDFSTLEKVRNVDIKRPREVNPAIPESIERIIMKALAKDVDERYQWCSEMLADLQQFLMGQDVVFTAKTLSGWLKEAFGGDLEKERGLLEQYKRVGRDGLIAGLPAAEAKLDVVEHLGEAPPIAEADATQLGGPSFDDIEKELAAIASPEVGPASGSPAAAGRQRTQSDAGEDFGEEAPTEIFGEIEHGAKPPTAAPPAAASPRAQTNTPAKRAPTGGPGPQPMTRAPVASRPLPSVPASTSSAPTMMSMQAPVIPQAQPHPAPPPMAQGGFAPYGAEYTPPPQPQLPVGTPGPLTPPPQAGANSQGRTVMGVQAPAGLPNYSQGYPQPQPPHQQQQPSTPPPMAFDPQTGQPLHPQTPQQYPQVGGGGYQQSYASPNPYANQTPNPYNQQAPQQPQNPYGSGGYQQPQYNGDPQQAYGQYPSAANYQQNFNQSGPLPVASVEKPAEGRKKASLGRDIGIGVAIAIVVLGVFLLVKFVILDSGGDKSGTIATGSGSASGIATLRISLPGEQASGPGAQLFIDDKSIGMFHDKAEVLTNVGTRKVRLVKDDTKCEREMKLEADKPNVFDCIITPKLDVGSAGSGSATAVAVQPATGSGSGSGSGSAAAAGTGSGSGSAVVVIEKKPDPVKPVDVKPLEPKKPDPVKPPDKKPDVVVVKPPDKKPDPKPPEDKKPASDKGFLEVYSTPKAKILVDGVDTGMSTPIAGKSLPLTPGKHKITFLVGEDRFTFQAIVKAGQTETMRKELN